MPSFPYLLFKQEVQMLKQSLLRECPTNELGGYEGVPVKDYEVIETQRNQPKWRQIWFNKDRLHKLHYVTAPQQMRIDSMFCPVRRQFD